MWTTTPSQEHKPKPSKEGQRSPFQKNEKPFNIEDEQEEEDDSTRLTMLKNAADGHTILCNKVKAIASRAAKTIKQDDDNKVAYAQNQEVIQKTKEAYSKVDKQEANKAKFNDKQEQQIRATWWKQNSRSKMTHKDEQALAEWQN